MRQRRLCPNRLIFRETTKLAAVIERMMHMHAELTCIMIRKFLANISDEAIAYTWKTRLRMFHKSTFVLRLESRRNLHLLQAIAAGLSLTSRCMKICSPGKKLTKPEINDTVKETDI